MKPRGRFEDFPQNWGMVNTGRFCRAANQYRAEFTLRSQLMKKFLLVCIMSGIWLTGCGSEGAGTLSVSTPTTNNGVVTATATLTRSSGSTLSGQTINFIWYTVGVTSKTQSAEITSSVKTDNSGIASSQLILAPSRSESFIVYVKANAGDLTNIQGWQSTTVAP